jgi:ankyrin repeat protein
LHFAARNGSLELARMLIDSEKVDVKARGYSGSTALHVAPQSGSLEVVSLLINSGADITMKINEGETALDLALERDSDREVAQVLEDAAANNGVVEIARMCDVES